MVKMTINEAKRYSIVKKLPENDAFEYLTIPNSEIHTPLYELDLYTGNFENCDEIREALGISSEYELWLTYKNFGKDWFIPLAYKKDRSILEIAQGRNNGNEANEQMDKLVYLFSLICSRNYFMRQENYAKEKTLANSFFTDCNLSPDTTQAIIDYFNGEFSATKLLNNFKSNIKSYRKIRNIYFALKQMIAKITLKELDEKIVSREMFLLMQELHIDTGIINKDLIANIYETDMKTINAVEGLPSGSNLKDNLLSVVPGLRPNGPLELVYDETTGQWVQNQNVVDPNKIIFDEATKEVPLLEVPEEPELLANSSQVLLEQPDIIEQTPDLDEQYDPHGTPEERALEAQYDKDRASIPVTSNATGEVPPIVDVDYQAWLEMSQDQKRSVINGIGDVNDISSGSNPVLSKTLPAFKGTQEADGQLPLPVPGEPELIR